MQLFLIASSLTLLYWYFSKLKYLEKSSYRRRNQNQHWFQRKHIQNCSRWCSQIDYNCSAAPTESLYSATSPLMAEALGLHMGYGYQACRGYENASLNQISQLIVEAVVQ
ncbi:conserved hypothetical protein [Ricinus communis]|uniref:Uncharacterized protein n=1 Tax=Ricinus communis TaxID=3988 RepID=B9RG06_RICCO|nr:conserved hypothetical protein [Ricinus communis]